MGAGGVRPSAEPKAEVTTVEYADEIAVGESTIVEMNVAYSNLEPNTKLEAQIADDDTSSSLGYRDTTLSGTGEYLFTLSLRATRAGDWHLVARVLWVATGNVIDHLHRFTIKVVPAVAPVFDFSVEVDPSAVSMNPGDSALCGISVGLITGPAQEVSLMYTIPPVTGVSASISTVKGTPPFNLMLKIATTPQTPPGTYTINVVGISGPLQRTTTVTLTVAAAVSFDFALKFEPSVVALRQGEYALADVEVGIISGQPQEVILTYTIPPVPGISATLDRTKGIPLFKSTLRIETTTQTPPGTYIVNVAGIAGTVTRVASLTVKVESAQPPPGFDFDIKVEPTVVFLKPGESAPCDVSVGRVTGTAQEVSLIYTIPPVAGISASLSHAKAMAPFDSTLTIATTPQTPAGTYTINVVGISGSLQRTTTMTLTVTEEPQPPTTATDWAVGDIWILPSNPRPGDQVTFSGEISALSSDKAFPQEVRVEVRLDHIQVAADTVSVPRQGLAVTVSAGTRWIAVAGAHTAVFSVDPADGIGNDDPDRGNNIGELSFTVSQTMTTTQQVQATTQAPLTSVATTQVASQTTGTKGSLGEALGGGGIFLLLLVVVIVAGAAYYVSRRRKAKPS